MIRKLAVLTLIGCLPLSLQAARVCSATVTSIRKDFRSQRLILTMAFKLGPVQVCDLDDDGVGGLSRSECHELMNFAQTSFSTGRKLKLFFNADSHQSCKSLMPRDTNRLIESDIYSIEMTW